MSDFYDRSRNLYHIPYGAVAEVIAPNGHDVLVEGTILTLTGKVRTLSARGEINLIRDATVNSIYRYVHVKKVMDSRVINIDGALVEEVEECHVTNIWGTSRVGSVSNSRVEFIAGTSAVGMVSDSTVEEIGGRATVHNLYGDTRVYQAVSDCVIGASGVKVTVDVATDRAVLRNFDGAVRSARGEAYVGLGVCGYVRATGGRATTPNVPESPRGWEAQCEALPDGRVLVYKATPGNGVTGTRYGEPTQWEPGKTLATEGKGFHFCPTITDALEWVFLPAFAGKRFFQCAVSAESIEPVTPTNGRSKCIEVLREVDRLGNPIKEEK